MKTAHDVSAHNVAVHTAAAQHDADHDDSVYDGSAHEAALDAACLTEIARAHTTPTYIFNVPAFRARLAKTRDILSSADVNASARISMCYSMKANPFLTSAAHSEHYKLEVCSPGELDICIAQHIPGARIVYSGVCKQPDDIRVALSYHVGVITAESPLQLEAINRVATTLHAAGELAYSRVPVLLRLNAKSQFGMAQSDLEALIAARDTFPLLEFVGIHYFVGTQRKKLARQQKELAFLSNFIDELYDNYGWRAQLLEYGPGLAYPYFVDDDMSDTYAPARELAPLLQKLAQKVDICIEMGRFLASACGTYVSRIVDVKQGADSDSYYAFIDGGINHVAYLGQMMGLKCPHIDVLPRDASSACDGSGVVNPAPARQMRRWTLCGSLCTTADVLVREFEASLAMGDLVAFQHIGAYSVTEAMYLFLSRTLPSVVLYYDSEHYVCVRKPIHTSSINCACMS